MNQRSVHIRYFIIYTDRKEIKECDEKKDSECIRSKVKRNEGDKERREKKSNVTQEEHPQHVRNNYPPSSSLCRDYWDPAATSCARASSSPVLFRDRRSSPMTTCGLLFIPSTVAPR